MKRTVDTPPSSSQALVRSPRSMTLDPRGRSGLALEPGSAVCHSSPAGTNAAPMTSEAAAMTRVARWTCFSRGLGAVLPRCDSAAIRPSSVCISVSDDRRGLTPGAARPAEDQIYRLEQRPRDGSRVSRSAREQ